MEKWISLNEYARRYNMHTERVKQMIATGKLEYFQTEGRALQN